MNRSDFMWKKVIRCLNLFLLPIFSLLRMRTWQHNSTSIFASLLEVITQHFTLSLSLVGS